MHRSKRISTIFESQGIDEKIKTAEAASTKEGLWNDRDEAERILKELKYWTTLKEIWEGIRKKKEDLKELSNLIDPDNAAEVKDYQNELTSLEKTHSKAHTALLLSGPYDKNDAILVISAGTGGTEAQDWAQMLMRMYLRFAEQHGFQALMVEKQDADDAGIKSCMIEMRGPMAYGYLKSEHGTHRLVRLSPFNAKNLRQTSFSLVEVLPVFKETEGVQINEKDLRVDTYRSGGAGGQHVNKTESAIRITHLPTGMVVTCQSERSQGQNRAQAMSVLKARLMQRMIQERKEKLEDLKGGYKEAAWGNQIRSYVFQPYKMVKDHRTNAETSQVEAVMDGDLDLFIEAYLRNPS